MQLKMRVPPINIAKKVKAVTKDDKDAFNREWAIILNTAKEAIEEKGIDVGVDYDGVFGGQPKNSFKRELNKKKPMITKPKSGADPTAMAQEAMKIRAAMLAKRGAKKK